MGKVDTFLEVNAAFAVTDAYAQEKITARQGVMVRKCLDPHEPVRPPLREFDRSDAYGRQGRSCRGQVSSGYRVVAV